MTIFVHQDEFEEHEQKVLAGIHRAVNPDDIELESDLALIAVVGRGMRQTRGTAGRIFSALAHAHVNVKMIDQGSSELNIIIGVENRDFETALKAIYDIFCSDTDLINKKDPGNRVFLHLSQNTRRNYMITRQIKLNATERCTGICERGGKMQL